MLHQPSKTSADKIRASGPISLGEDERIELTKVQLGSIFGLHPEIEARNARLDLAPYCAADLNLWDPLALDVLLNAAPPWVFARGEAAAKHHLVLCGGQFLPALRRLLKAEAVIPVMLIDSKLGPARLLQIAAAHEAAVAAKGVSLGHKSVSLILEDAAKAWREHKKEVENMQVEDQIGQPYSRALGLSATPR